MPSMRLALVGSVVALALAWGCGLGGGTAEFPDGADADTDGTIDPFAIGEGGPQGEGGPGGPVCGNAAIDPGETCDDGNQTPGDGCSATCQIEPGYKCATVGAACVAAVCGDGIVAGNEDCDDGNTTSGDGCSAICVLESGFKCPTPGKACVPTVCGDGVKEGTEQCDDGNLRPYDGCSPTCTIEPVCSGGTCTAVCGDGVKFPSEQCDDGNTRSGDGCSATCTLEPGFQCTVVTSALPATIDIPVIYRDFLGNPAAGDFEHLCCGVTPGIVQNALAADNEPAFNTAYAGGLVTSKTTFDQWYHDTAGVNQVLFDKLTLTKQPDNSYLFSSTSFFPIDGKGFGNYASSGHNFHFTSELRSYFTYQGGEILDFTGDDDVFVFINAKLAVDIGGVHGATNGNITLNAAAATTLGLTVGGMYEFDVFQAERHTTESNYKLTLSGFVKAKTSCTPICGDGIKTKNEACDNGTANNTGGYGKCNPDCTLGPRCGDGIVQADQGEQCDDGNLVSGDGCSSTCQIDTVVPH